MTRNAEDYPLAGPQVSGLDVGDDVPNADSISATLDEYEIAEHIREVPLSDFGSAPHDMFYAADDIDHAEELASRIGDNGWVSPLIVVIDEKGPYILEGAHRLAALHILGKATFPALVVTEITEEPE